METTGVVQAAQGVVNQANKTSTQETDARARQAKQAPAADTGVKLSPEAARELKSRVDEILAGLKKSGVSLPDREDATAQAVKTAPRVDRTSYIDVLHDVLLGETSVDAMTFGEFVQESASGAVAPKLPAYPFDRSFLQVSLQYLKTLVQGEGALDQHLAQRIQTQLEALEKDAEQSGAAASKPLFEEVI